MIASVNHVISNDQCSFCQSLVDSASPRILQCQNVVQDCARLWYDEALMMAGSCWFNHMVNVPFDSPFNIHS